MTNVQAISILMKRKEIVSKWKTSRRIVWLRSVHYNESRLQQTLLATPNPLTLETNLKFRKSIGFKCCMGRVFKWIVQQSFPFKQIALQLLFTFLFYDYCWNSLQLFVYAKISWSHFEWFSKAFKRIPWTIRYFSYFICIIISISYLRKQN